MALLGLGLCSPLPVSAAASAAGAQAAETEATTAQALAARADDHARMDPQASRQFAERALAMLAADPGGGDVDTFVQAHLLLCEHHAERSREDAERHLQAARQRLDDVRRAGLRARQLACEGDLQENAGHNAAALTLYEQAVLSAEQAGDEEYLAESLFRRGNLRSLRAEYATGLRDLKRAHTLFERVGRPIHATTVHNAIAILYNRMGDPAQARHYFELALKAQTAAGLKREQVVTVHNLGRTLENLGDWPAAEHAFGQCLSLSRELGFDRGQAYALRGLAGVQHARGQHEQALEGLHLAETLQRRTPDARLRGQIQLQRGQVLLALGRLGPATTALQEALAVFEQAESPAERLRTHDALVRLMEARHDPAAALTHARAARALAEQLLRRQLDDRFATLKVEVDAAAREQEVRLLKREQAATSYALEQERMAGRWRSALVAAGTVALAALAWLAWRLRHGKLAMHRLAMTDELTQLPNRRDVLARLEARLQRAEPCAALIVDLDHFKRINDEQGYASGDRALRSVASVLRHEIPSSASLGRLGGEEFLIVLHGFTRDEALAAAERVRQAIEAMPHASLELARPVTASIGVAASVGGDTLGALLHRADVALHAAKDGGRNRVVWRSAGTTAAAAAGAAIV